MQTTSLFDAKTHLSRIISELVDGTEEEVQITRRGKPVAKLTPIRSVDVSDRIGCAEGQFTVPEDIDETNPEILEMFAGRGDDCASSS